MGLTSLAHHPSACCAQMQALSLQSRCEQLESKLAQLEAELTEAKQRAAAAEDRLAKSGRWEQAYLAGLPQAPSVGGARLAAALQLFRHARPPAGPPVQPAYLFSFLCRAGGTSLQEVAHGLRQELQEKDLQLMQARHCPPVSPAAPARSSMPVAASRPCPQLALQERSCHAMAMTSSRSSLARDATQLLEQSTCSLQPAVHPPGPAVPRCALCCCRCTMTWCENAARPKSFRSKFWTRQAASECHFAPEVLSCA